MVTLPAFTGHFVLPAFALLIFLAFLVLLAVLARIAASATRGEREGSRGCLGGCGLVLVLAFLCALGAAGFVGFLLAALGATAAEHNPVRAITVIRDEAAPDRPGIAPLTVSIEVEGDDAARRVVEALRRRFGDELDLDVRREDGRTAIELRLPVEQRDLEELRRELDALGVELPRGLRVRLSTRGPI